MDFPVPRPAGPEVGHPSDEADARRRWQDAWAAALGEVELQADEIEHVLAAVHRGGELPDALAVLQRRWEPPAGLGPIPPAFVARAQALLLRHSQLADDIGRTAAAVRRHEHVVDSLSAQPPTVPAFVDVNL